MTCVLFAEMDKVFSKKKNIKNTGKWKKILEKSGNFVSPEKLELCSSTDTRLIIRLLKHTH